jgi:flagellar hook-associated protein 3 FlgL
MDALDGDFDRLISAISTVGTKMNRMDIKSTIYQDLTISETERLSGIEDADITEAITNLQQKQLVYQAALASSSKVMQLSLVDYL